MPANSSVLNRVKMFEKTSESPAPLPRSASPNPARFRGRDSPWSTSKNGQTESVDQSAESVSTTPSRAMSPVVRHPTSTGKESPWSAKKLVPSSTEKNNKSIVAGEPAVPPSRAKSPLPRARVSGRESPWSARKISATASEDQSFATAESTILASIGPSRTMSPVPSAISGRESSWAVCKLGMTNSEDHSCISMHTEETPGNPIQDKNNEGTSNTKKSAPKFLAYYERKRHVFDDTDDHALEIKESLSSVSHDSSKLEDDDENPTNGIEQQQSPEVQSVKSKTYSSYGKQSAEIQNAPQVSSPWGGVVLRKARTPVKNEFSTPEKNNAVDAVESRVGLTHANPSNSNIKGSPFSNEALQSTPKAKTVKPWQRKAATPKSEIVVTASPVAPSEAQDGEGEGKSNESEHLVPPRMNLPSSSKNKSSPFGNKVLQPPSETKPVRPWQRKVATPKSETFVTAPPVAPSEDRDDEEEGNSKESKYSESARMNPPSASKIKSSPLGNKVLQSPSETKPVRPWQRKVATPKSDTVVAAPPEAPSVDRDDEPEGNSNKCKEHFESPRMILANSWKPNKTSGSSSEPVGDGEVGASKDANDDIETPRRKSLRTWTPKQTSKSPTAASDKTSTPNTKTVGTKSISDSSTFQESPLRKWKQHASTPKSLRADENTSDKVKETGHGRNDFDSNVAESTRVTTDVNTPSKESFSDYSSTIDKETTNTQSASGSSSHRESPLKKWQLKVSTPKLPKGEESTEDGKVLKTDEGSTTSGASFFSDVRSALKSPSGSLVAGGSPAVSVCTPLSNARMTLKPPAKSQALQGSPAVSTSGSLSNAQVNLKSPAGIKALHGSAAKSFTPRSKRDVVGWPSEEEEDDDKCSVYSTRNESPQASKSGPKVYAVPRAPENPSPSTHPKDKQTIESEVREDVETESIISIGNDSSLGMNTQSIIVPSNTEQVEWPSTEEEQTVVKENAVAPSPSSAMTPRMQRMKMMRMMGKARNNHRSRLSATPTNSAPIPPSSSPPKSQPNMISKQRHAVEDLSCESEVGTTKLKHNLESASVVMTEERESSVGSASSTRSSLSTAELSSIAISAMNASKKDVKSTKSLLSTKRLLVSKIQKSRSYASHRRTYSSLDDDNMSVGCSVATDATLESVQTQSSRNSRASKLSKAKKNTAYRTIRKEPTPVPPRDPEASVGTTGSTQFLLRTSSSISYGIEEATCRSNDIDDTSTIQTTSSDQLTDDCQSVQSTNKQSSQTGTNNQEKRGLRRNRVDAMRRVATDRSLKKYHKSTSNNVNRYVNDSPLNVPRAQSPYQSPRNAKSPVPQPPVEGVVPQRKVSRSGDSNISKSENYNSVAQQQRSLASKKSDKLPRNVKDDSTLISARENTDEDVSQNASPTPRSMKQKLRRRASRSPADRRTPVSSGEKIRQEASKVGSPTPSKQMNLKQVSPRKSPRSSGNNSELTDRNKASARDTGILKSMPPPTTLSNRVPDSPLQKSSSMVEESKSNAEIKNGISSLRNTSSSPDQPKLLARVATGAVRVTSPTGMNSAITTESTRHSSSHMTLGDTEPASAAFSQAPTDLKDSGNVINHKPESVIEMEDDRKEDSSGITEQQPSLMNEPSNMDGFAFSPRSNNDSTLFGCLDKDSTDIDQTQIEDETQLFSGISPTAKDDQNTYRSDECSTLILSELSEAEKDISKNQKKKKKRRKDKKSDKRNFVPQLNLSSSEDSADLFDGLDKIKTPKNLVTCGFNDMALANENDEVQRNKSIVSVDDDASKYSGVQNTLNVASFNRESLDEDQDMATTLDMHIRTKPLMDATSIETSDQSSSSASKSQLNILSNTDVQTRSIEEYSDGGSTWTPIDWTKPELEITDNKHILTTLNEEEIFTENSEEESELKSEKSDKVDSVGDPVLNDRTSSMDSVSQIHMSALAALGEPVLSNGDTSFRNDESFRHEESFRTEESFRKEESFRSEELLRHEESFRNEVKDLLEIGKQQPPPPPPPPPPPTIPMLKQRSASWDATNMQSTTEDAEIKLTYSAGDEQQVPVNERSASRYAKKEEARDNTSWAFMKFGCTLMESMGVNICRQDGVKRVGSAKQDGFGFESRLKESMKDLQQVMKVDRNISLESGSMASTSSREPSLLTVAEKNKWNLWQRSEFERMADPSTIAEGSTMGSETMDSQDSSTMYSNSLLTEDESTARSFERDTTNGTMDTASIYDGRSQSQNERKVFQNPAYTGGSEDSEETEGASSGYDSSTRGGSSSYSGSSVEYTSSNSTDASDQPSELHLSGKARRAAALSFGERRILEEFTGRLKNYGLEVLKLSSDNKWQVRFLTVSKEIAELKEEERGGECPQAILWLKKFSHKNHSASSIDRNGKGGLFTNQLLKVAVAGRRDPHYQLSKKLQAKFMESVALDISYYKGEKKRSILFLCKNTDDAHFLCTSLRVTIDMLKK